MQDEHIIPAQDIPPTTPADKPSEKEFNWKIILICLGAVTLLLIAGGISYFIGRQSRSTEEPTPTPSLSPTPIPTFTPTPTSTISATLTPTVTPTPTPEIQTKTLSSTASLDGFRSSNHGGNAGLDIRAGRNINLATRGFVSFELSDIPEDATVTKVTLRLYQTKVVGDPYGVGGNLKVDHLAYGDSLDDNDYASAALLSSFSTLTSNATVEWKDVDVTEAVNNDIAEERTRSQFRIHFETENTGGDATGDFAYFESADNSEGSGNTPKLVIEYH